MDEATDKLHGDSADILIYRQNVPGNIEVLTGIRQYEPWKGCVTIPFGGHVEASDNNLLEAAFREVAEETGLIVEVDFFVGIYGPKRIHCAFDGRRAYPICGDRSSVNHAFAGHAVGGELKDTEEQRNLKFMLLDELACKELAFDHARVLADFLDALEDGSAKTWRKETLKLVK